jgi:hypothetical protein
LQRSLERELPVKAGKFSQPVGPNLKSFCKGHQQNIERISILFTRFLKASGKQAICVEGACLLGKSPLILLEIILAIYLMVYTLEKFRGEPDPGQGGR